MTSSTPASKSQEQRQPSAVGSPSAGAVPGSDRKPWWRRWSEPIVVATVFGSLIAVFVMSGAAGFQSIKGDIHASEARVHEEVSTSEARLHEEIQTTETRLRDEIHASEARLNKRIDD
ncbi:MAG: hypothetical protein F4Z10_04785, partial [Synechococcus sp. SB0666_bin_14]|nr:hypothetical protein [Synechococcus sp. SB0666_bin_14]